MSDWWKCMHALRLHVFAYQLPLYTLHPENIPGGFSPFCLFFCVFRRQANFWRCSCHMFVVLLKRPRLKLPTSLRCWKGKSVQPRLPVWIARYIGPWDRCLYQHFLAWSCREMMPLGPCLNKRSKCCAAVWAEHGWLHVPVHFWSCHNMCLEVTAGWFWVSTDLWVSICIHPLSEW